MSTEAPLALIFGAGKVGRGFLGQLLSRSGYQLWFVDRDAALVARLEAARRYPVLVMQELPRRVSVEGVRALHSGDTDAVAERFARAAVVLTAVGDRTCRTWRGRSRAGWGAGGGPRERRRSTS